MPRRRLLGRPVEALVDDATGNVLATFQDGAKRRYTRDEIGEYVAELAQLLATGREHLVPESWFEFLQGIVGKETMEAAVLVAAMCEPDELPPGLRITPGPAAV